MHQQETSPNGGIVLANVEARKFFGELWGSAQRQVPRGRFMQLPCLAFSGIRGGFHVNTH